MTLEQSWHRVPGGTAVAALGMARALRAEGATEIIGVSARHRAMAQDPWVPPVAVKQLPLPRAVLYESWHRFRKPRVQMATGDVDVIHATTMAIPPRSAPLVVTIHDLAWLTAPDHFTRRGVRFFNKGLALSLAEADLVLCPSEATRAACVRAGFAESRVRVAPLGIDLAEVTPEDVARVQARYSLHRPYILWTGTIEPRKNLPGLLRAFTSLDSKCDLVLVGPKGWNEDIDTLITQALATGGGKRTIRTLGFVDGNDLPALYAGAEVFCFPSLLEGFGFPVLEAMAQGTAVVTSRGTSTEEIAGDAAVLVDPTDDESIRQGLASALEDTELRRRLATAGPTQAARFSWTNTARLLTDAYREVAA